MAESIKIKFTGDVEAFATFLRAPLLKKNLEDNLRRATIASSLLLVKLVKLEIRNRNFDKNAPLTLALKSTNLALTDERNLWDAITFQLQSSFTSEVGVVENRISTGSKGKGNKSVVMMQHLVELMETGYVIDVTPAMRAAVMAAIRRPNKMGGSSSSSLGKEGTAAPAETWRVPPRKVLTQVWNQPQIQRELRKNWLKALRNTFKRQGAK